MGRKRQRMTWSLDWSSLDQDVLQLIGWRVLAGDLLDYVRFRAVCKHWSSSTLRPGGRGLLDPRFRPRRWMMLPEGHGLYPGHPDLNGDVRFFNLSTGAFARARLPLLGDHAILDTVDGLLLLHRDRDTAVRLLHPFTGDVADLPPLDSLLPQMEPPRPYFSENSKRSAIRRLRASVAVVGAAGTITVMLAFELLHRVAYAAAGDRRWTLSDWKFLPLLRPVAFQGKFYSVQYLFQGINRLQIYQIDTPRRDAIDGRPHQPSPEKIAECPLDRIAHPVYLVECGSELLIVGYSDTTYRCMVAYRVADLASGNIVPMTRIGDHVLFLDERGLCVSPNNKSLPSISRNSIIYVPYISSEACDNGVEPKARLEEYDLASGTWSLATDEDCVEGPPSGPSTLIHHIFTCCCPDYWNKGILIGPETDQPEWPVKSDLRFGDLKSSCYHEGKSVVGSKANKRSLVAIAAVASMVTATFLFLDIC
ncbi:hypothetical protein ACP4OV_014892 [Aristida adscensionis]